MRFARSALLPALLALACLHRADRLPRLAVHGPLPVVQSVSVESRSEPVLCAEKDNVSIAAAGSGVRSFWIEARHPAYIGALQRDRTAADWTACDMSQDPVHESGRDAQRLVLYRGRGIQLVGHIWPAFWRSSRAIVRVGERTWSDIHLLQLHVQGRGREEALVLYPQDGYFRARPLTPPHLRETAYGSSFLLGPVELDGRPVVNLDEVSFDPEQLAFTLRFARGGQAVVRTAELDDAHHALAVQLDPPIDDVPFAMLRSMYVTEFNNDVARIAVRDPASAGWLEQNVMAFERASATDVWMGRLTPSQHNTSSPDMLFRAFSGAELVLAPAR